MAERRILEIGAEQSTVGTCFGKLFHFPGAGEVTGIHPTIGCTSIPTEILINLGERGFRGDFRRPQHLEEDAQGLTVDVSTFRYLGNQDFVRLDRTVYTPQGHMEVRSREVYEEEVRARFGIDYATEGADALVFVSGTDYDYYVAKTSTQVTVDGVEENGNHRFRLLVPRAAGTDLMRPLLVPNARLLVYENALATV